MQADGLTHGHPTLASERAELLITMPQVNVIALLFFFLMILLNGLRLFFVVVVAVVSFFLSNHFVAVSCHARRHIYLR